MRRLKQESSSYQALLDETRQQRAVWYLTHSNLAIEERWLGCLPSETRRAALDALKKTQANP
jgi:hypothetical protein